MREYPTRITMSARADIPSIPSIVLKLQPVIL